MSKPLSWIEQCLDSTMLNCYFIVKLFWSCFNNIEATLKQRRYNVVTTVYNVLSMLFQLLILTFNQCWKSNVIFCFNFSVRAMLFQHWSQRWKNVILTVKCGLNNGKDIYSFFLWKLENSWLFNEEKNASIKKYHRMAGIYFFLALANQFQLTPKPIRRVNKILWPTFYQMNLMKR